MTQQAFRQASDAADLADRDSLDELASIVAGNFERKARADEPVAPFDIEKELLQVLDAPARPVTRAAEFVASAAPRTRSLATPQARRELPAHNPPSLDASLEDQLLGELQTPDAPNSWDAAMARAAFESGIAVAAEHPAASSPARQPQRAEQAPAPRQVARQAVVPVSPRREEQAERIEDLDSLAREFSAPEPQSAPAQDEVRAAAPVAAAELRQPAQQIRQAPQAKPSPQPKHVFSEIDLDLGAAFKTAFDKLNTDRVERQMREATRLTAAERSERNAAAHARDLEAQFASAFEDELALSVQAIRGARQAMAEAEPIAPVATAKAPHRAEPETERRAAPRPSAKISRGPDPYAALLERELRAADLQADVGDDGYEEPRYATPPRRGMALRLSAYGLAAILVAGLGAVSYAYFGKSADASGPLVVKADADPFKIRPENPGGAQIANQDKAAYERLSGKFSNDAKQEKLIESAEEPVKIATAIQGDAVVGVDPNAAADGQSAEKAGERLAPGESEKTRSLGAVQPRRVKTLAIRADGSVIPAESAAAADAAAKLAAGGKDAAGLAAKAGTDPVKVDTVKLDAAAAAAGKDSELKVASIDPAKQAAGAWAVQVSSQKSSGDAEAAYRNLQRKFPQILDGRQMEIQKAEIADKGTFFRVRVIAASKEEAGAFCEKLKGAGGSCFVTR